MSESRPTPSLHTRLAILSIVALGLILRVWTIGNGIPHTVGTDEPEILGRVVNMMRSGDFNPHFFDYGGLTIYFHLAVASVRFAAGALGGEAGYRSLDAVWEGSFYLWARLATAFIGTLTIYVVYRIGRRRAAPTALVAALIVAIHPNLVRESHFALTDTPLTFLVALTMLISAIAAEDGRLRWFVLAGVTAGLATAIKYNGAVVLLVPLVVAAIGRMTSRRTPAVVGVIGGSAAAFVLGAPYSVIDLPEFLKAFAHLAASYNQARPPGVVAGIYISYLRSGFGLGIGGWSNFLGWPALWLGVLGLLAWLRPSSFRSRPVGVAMVVFAAVYFNLIAHQSLAYARYALPLIPVLCLGVATGIEGLARVFAGGNGRVQRAIRSALLLVLLPPFFQAMSFDVQRRKVTTEEQMAQWLEGHIAPEDPVILETPTVRLRPGFHVDYTHRLIHESLDAYRGRGVRYFVASSENFDAATTTPRDAAAYRQLFAATELVTVIQTRPDHPGPTLTVFRLPR